MAHLNYVTPQDSLVGCLWSTLPCGKSTTSPGDGQCLWVAGRHVHSYSWGFVEFAFGSRLFITKIEVISAFQHEIQPSFMRRILTVTLDEGVLDFERSVMKGFGKQRT